MSTRVMCDFCAEPFCCIVSVVWAFDPILQWSMKDLGAELFFTWACRASAAGSQRSTSRRRRRKKVEKNVPENNRLRLFSIGPLATGMNDRKANGANTSKAPQGELFDRNHNAHDSSAGRELLRQRQRRRRRTHRCWTR